MASGKSQHTSLSSEEGELEYEKIYQSNSGDITDLIRTSSG